MARKPDTPEPTQAEPTKPRPIDEDGRTLDAHGLPLSGPARLRALDGRPDPATAPADAPAPTEPAKD